MRRQRVLVVLTVLLLGCAFLQWRLLRLQFLQGELWARESQRSTMSFESLPFERGWILDRRGEPLARTEEVRDLSFRFREWRHWKRGAVAGQLGGLLWLLDGERRGTRELLDDTADFLADLGRLSVAEVAAVQPRQRQVDVRTCLKGLLGETWAEALGEALAEAGAQAAGADVAGAQAAGAQGAAWSGGQAAGSVRAWTPRRSLDALPGWNEAVARALQRTALERAALLDLGDAAGCGLGGLCASMDAAVAGNDARVDAALLRGVRGEDPFARARTLHAEEDNAADLLLERVSYACQTLVAIRGQELPGFSVSSERRRVYPQASADVATLLVGTLGRPGERDVAAATRDRARLADLVALEDPTEAELEEYETLRIRVREIDYHHEDERGLLGLEAALEPVLRGKRGWIATTPLAEGEEGGRVESMPPQRGLNVTLTLDLELQRAAERALDHFQPGSKGQDPFGHPASWPGAIVLLDPRTGAVLALATSPRPTREQLTTQYGTLLADIPRLGLLCQRALDPGASGNLAPPGSTFKPIAALAALSLGVISPATTFDCERTLLVGGTPLGCTGQHPDIDLRHALAQSCNIYFYRLAERVGGDVLRDVARAFGLASPTGLLLGNEVLAAHGIPVASGVHESAVPLKDGPLSRLQTMRLGIGQDTLDDVTPLQIAVAFGAIGTGELRPPSLIAAVEGYGVLPPRAAQPLPFGVEALRAVREGLALAVDSSRGTATDLHVPAELAGLTVAVKTGTPQVQSREDHSWMAGYMPRDAPRLAFAILLEHTGRHGGDACVPVLNELLEGSALREHLAQEQQP